MIGEDPITDCLSPVQLEYCLQQEVFAMQQECPLFPSLMMSKYYVIVGAEIEGTRFVKGGLLKSFALGFSTIAQLEKKVRSFGVPSEDKHATAIALEDLFKKEVRAAKKRILAYQRDLVGIRHPGTVEIEYILYLFQEISATHYIYKDKILHEDLSEKDKRMCERAIREYGRQLRELKRILRAKGSS
jgi:hypothetical protein